MRGHLRALLRILALAAVTGYHAAVLSARLVSARRDEDRLRRRLDQFRRWCRAVARISGMRIEPDGSPAAPPVLLVANHLSYMDVIALGATSPAIFVAKAPVARWPLLGPITRLAGTIFIDRARMSDLKRALAQMGAVLDAGFRVAFFPEGTSTAGDRVLPFRSPLLDAAIRRGLPVQPAAIRYETAPGDPPAGEAVCWWGDAVMAPHLWRLLGLRGFTAAVRYRPARTGPDRKQLASELRDDVCEALGLSEERSEERCLPGTA